MKRAFGEGIYGNIDGLAHLYRAHNRIRYSHADLHGIGFGESECRNPRPDESAQFYCFLNDITIEWSDERSIPQCDLRFAGQSASRFQLLLAGVELRASRIEFGF